MYPEKYRCAMSVSCRANRTYCVRIRMYSYVLRTYFCTYCVRIVRIRTYRTYFKTQRETDKKYVRIRTIRTNTYANTYAIRTTIRTQYVRYVHICIVFSHFRIRTYSYVLMYVFVRIVRIYTYCRMHSPCSSAS